MNTLQRIPMEEYLASNAFSASSAFNFVPENGTPYAWKFRKDNGISRVTKATNLGEAGHEAVFEPEIFDKKWSWYPGSRTRKKGPDGPVPSGAYEEWIAETGNDDRFVLNEEEWRYLYALRKRIRELPGPAVLLESGLAEQSYFFPYSFTGSDGEIHEVDCRIRWDFLDPDRRIGVDLKTCESLKDKKLAAAFANYGYPFKAIQYINGMAHYLGEDPVDWSNPESAPPFFFLCVSKQIPIEVRLLQLSTDDLVKSAVMYHEALELYCKCRDSGVWPGLPNQIQTLAMPKWYGNNVA